MPEQSAFMTTAEVAALLRTPVETVRFWRHARKGPRSFKVGRRVLYDRADVEAFIADARESQLA
jgi:excisionase family DNA binding protein